MTEPVLPLGSKIRSLRIEEKGWTLTQLAEAARISAQTARKAERGEKISEVSLARIANALGTTSRNLSASGEGD
jgi:transcriptional regulator with XRE-family HTH domain